MGIPSTGALRHPETNQKGQDGSNGSNRHILSEWIILWTSRNSSRHGTDLSDKAIEPFNLKDEYSDSFWRHSTPWVPPFYSETITLFSSIRVGNTKLVLCPLYPFYSPVSQHIYRPLRYYDQTILLRERRLDIVYFNLL
jgi:hypothetical protein